MSFPNTTPTRSDAVHSVNQLADQAADKAQGLIEQAKHSTSDALDSLKSGVEHVREAVPSAFARNAAQVEDLARRGIERARETSAAVREQYHRTGEATRHYIQDEPLKSVVIAAVAGAALAGLIGWLGRSRSSQPTLR